MWQQSVRMEPGEARGAMLDWSKRASAKFEGRSPTRVRPGLLFAPPGLRTNAAPGAAAALADQALDRAECLRGALVRGSFDRAVERDDVLAGRRDRRAAAAFPAGRRGDRGLFQRRVDLFDQQPGAPIRHADPPCRGRDRAGRLDGFEQRDLARADAIAIGEVDADA